MDFWRDEEHLIGLPIPVRVGGAHSYELSYQLLVSNIIFPLI